MNWLLRRRLVASASARWPRAGCSRCLPRHWPNTVVEDNNVTKAVSVLRRVIGSELIVTVPRRGDQFVAGVQRIESVPASYEAAAVLLDDPGKTLRAVDASPPSGIARTVLLRALAALALAATLVVIGVAALTA